MHTFACKNTILIEQIGNSRTRRPARAVMFDFDGTVALVRAGWMPVMLDMMMETLAPLGSDRTALRAEAEDYVARFTGKDTVHQMAAFADHVRTLGGEPLSPAQYKADFIALLEAEKIERLDAVRAGTRPASDLLVPGTVELLGALRNRGIRVYLASGTAHEDICYESELLGIAALFDGIYGSAPGRMSKREVLEWIVESGVGRDEVLTFGDGRVEIEETKAVGGTAVGVATDEESGCIAVDPKKRGWLIEAGADYIIPNYLDAGVMRIVEAAS
jgi:phosphoglycolate phosphatase